MFASQKLKYWAICLTIVQWQSQLIWVLLVGSEWFHTQSECIGHGWVTLSANPGVNWLPLKVFSCYFELCQWSYYLAMPVVTAENLWPGQSGWEWRDLSTSTTTQGKCLSPTVLMMFVLDSTDRARVMLLYMSEGWRILFYTARQISDLKWFILIMPMKPWFSDD